MDRRLLLSVVVVAACGSASPTAGPMLANAPAALPPELAAIEAARKRPLDHVILATSGVYVNRKRIAPLDQVAAQGGELDAALGRVALDPSTRTLEVMVAAPAASAATLEGALRRISKSYSMLELSTASDGTGRTLCTSIEVRTTRWSDEPMDDAPVMLAVFLDGASAWIGLSRVNEFQQTMPRDGTLDVEKLEDNLKTHKASAFFADREEVELGAGSGVSGDAYLSALGAACKVGFVKIALLPLAELSARPPS